MSWTLQSGQSFEITSRSGNSYAVTFITRGAQDAGLYVRLVDGKLGRLRPERLDWNTLARRGHGQSLRVGDQLLLETFEGREIRGRLAALGDDIEVELPTGEVYMVPVHLVVSPVRLLFRASDLCPGDEFEVESVSGSRYRGRALAVEDERVVAVIGGEKMTLKRSRLRMDTLLVLVPVVLREPAAS